MSLFLNDSRIDNIPCSVTAVGGVNSVKYQVTFERRNASLEQIEAINWRRPQLDPGCPLPRGCGFEVADIRYSMGTLSYIVTLWLKERYLGDVTRYQTQIETLELERARLESDNANQKDTIQRLSGQLAEADETAIALYEELEAARAEGPEADETETEPAELSEAADPAEIVEVEK